MTRSRDVADTQDNLGGAVAPFVGAKNKILNSDFGIWQRGTSITAGTGTVYNADRFYSGRDGSGATVTVSRQQFTPGTAPVAGYESLYFLRFNQSVAGSGGSYSVVGQRIEGATTLANQNATVSFWAKTDTNRTITLNFNRNYGTGGSGDDYNLLTAPSFNVTTSWQRFTASFTIPSVAGKTVASNGYLEMNFFLAGNTVQTFDLWGVQLEVGNVATPFTPAGGGFPGAELALCQRYYWRSPSLVNNHLGLGFGRSTTGTRTGVALPVQMRVAATSVDFANLNVANTVSGFSVTSLTLAFSSPNYPTVDANVASGLTQFSPYFLVDAGSGTGYIGFSAEL